MSEYLMQQAKKDIRALYTTLAYILEDEEDNVQIHWTEQTDYYTLSRIKIFYRTMTLPLDNFMDAFSHSSVLLTFNYQKEVELEHESKESWSCVNINLMPCEYIDLEQIHRVVNALIHAIQTQNKTAEEAIDFLITTGVISSDINNP